MILPVHLGRVVPFLGGDRSPDARRLIGLYARTSELLAQKAARRQRSVTDQFRVQAEARPPGQEPVIRIALEEFRRRGGLLTVDRSREVAVRQALVDATAGRVQLEKESL